MMAILKKYWKPLAEILLVAFLLCAAAYWCYSRGYQEADSSWKLQWAQRDLTDATTTLQREVAWCAINLELDLANEVINGSNTTVNPLYYDQQGIGRLQRRALKTLRSGISYGLILGQVIDTQLAQEVFNDEYEKGVYAGNAVINAVPFANYTSLNQSDYADGKYNGLSAVITPRRGFESITFNLNVTNFVGA